MINILLYSGGNDSKMILHKYNDVDFIKIYFNYGQKYYNQEKKYLSFDTTIIKTPILKMNKVGFFFGRNLMFLIEIAKRYKTGIIWMGTNKNDVFDDNNKTFLNNVIDVINISYNTKFKIKLPLKNTSKYKIMQYINKYKIDTYSCYVGKTKPCGKCKACKSIEEAIKCR